MSPSMRGHVRDRTSQDTWSTILSTTVRIRTRALTAVLGFMIVAIVGACRERAPTVPPAQAHVIPTNICGGPCCGTTDPNCYVHPPLVTGDTAKVFCTPRTLTRGDSVFCRVYIGRHRPFDVTQRSAQGLSVFSPFDVDGGSDPGHFASDTARWKGVAVASTAVAITVEWIDSAHVHHQLPVAFDTFVVRPRVLSEYAISNSPRAFRDSIEPTQMTKYPQHYVRDSTGAVVSKSAVYGLFVADNVFTRARDSTISFATRVDSGPNASLWWFRTLPVLTDSTQVWLHPGLDGGGSISQAVFWYRTQDGRPFGAVFQHDSTILHDNRTGLDTIPRT